MKVEKILDGFVEYSDFLDNVLIGKTKDGYLTFIQKDDYTIINKEILDKKIVKILPTHKAFRFPPFIIFLQF